MWYYKKFPCRTNSLRLFVLHGRVPAVASSHRAVRFRLDILPFILQQIMKKGDSDIEKDEEKDKKKQRRTLRVESTSKCNIKK